MKLLMQIGMLLCFTIPTFSQDNRNPFFEYSNEKSLIKVENITKTENGNLEIDLCFKNTSEKIFYPFVVSVGKNTQYGDNKSLYDKKSKTVSTKHFTINGSNVKIILTSKIKDFWMQKIYPKDSLKFKIITEINNFNYNEKFVIDCNYTFCSLNYNVTSTLEELTSRYVSSETGKITVWPSMPKIFKPKPDEWYLVKSKNNNIRNDRIKYANFGIGGRLVLRAFYPFSQYYLNRLKEGEGTYLNGQRLSFSDGTLIKYEKDYFDFILQTSNDIQEGKIYEQETILKVSTYFSEETDELYVTNEIASDAPNFRIDDEINFFYKINTVSSRSESSSPIELKKYIDLQMKDSRFNFNKLDWGCLNLLFRQNVYKNEAAIEILNSKLLDIESIEMLVKCNCIEKNKLEEKAYAFLVSPVSIYKNRKFISLFPNSLKLSLAKENLQKSIQYEDEAVKKLIENSKSSPTNSNNSNISSLNMSDYEISIKFDNSGNFEDRFREIHRIFNKKTFKVIYVARYYKGNPNKWYISQFCDGRSYSDYNEVVKAAIVEMNY